MKKRLLIVLTIMTLFIGGCSKTMSVEEKEIIQKEQERMARYVYNNYENV